MANQNIDMISKEGYVLNQPSPGLPWVLRVSLEHWGKDFLNARRPSDSRFLAYVREGVMLVRGGRETLEAGPGNVVYLGQDAADREVAVATEGGVRVIVAIVRGPAGCGLVSARLGDATRLFAVGDSGSVESLFFCMLQASAKGYPASSDIAASLLAPTLLTIQQEHASANAAAHPNRQLFNRCREFVTHNYLAIKSVAGVAERFDISHARLCRLFKLYEGCSPHSFLLQRKMTHALYELQHRARSVAEIAYELGFADPYSFSKSFKRVMGCSPSWARTAQGALRTKTP